MRVSQCSNDSLKRFVEMISCDVRLNLRRDNVGKLLITRNKDVWSHHEEIMMILFLNHIDLFVIQRVKLCAEENLNRKQV